MFVLPTIVNYSLHREYHYCMSEQEPTTRTKIDGYISLFLLGQLQLDSQHSCGNFKGAAASGTNQMLNSDLSLQRLSLGFSPVRIQISHCGCAGECDMDIRTLLVALK